MLEIFYVNQPVSFTAQVQDFVGWLQRNSQVLAGFEKKAPQIEGTLKALYECAIPEMKETYWTSVQTLVFLGFNEAAIDLLVQHSAWTRWQNKDMAVKAQFEILESLITILQKMPRLAGSSNASAAVVGAAKVFTNASDFEVYRQKWLLACRQLLQNEVLWLECANSDEMTALGAKAVLSGLSGHEKTLRARAGTWTDLLCAQLLHRYSSLESFAELSSLTEYCIDSRDGAAAAAGSSGGDDGDGDGGVSFVADILLAILNDNVQEVISLCSQTLGPWFMAHAPDLFIDAKRQELQQMAGQQFERFVVEFTEALMPNTSMWQTVCDYLAWCPTWGEGALQIYLERLPVSRSDDKTVLQALEVADRHALPACAAQICRTLGVSRWQQGQRGSAVLWLRRGHDDRRVKHYIAEQKGRMDELDQILESLAEYERRRQTDEGGDGRAELDEILETLTGYAFKHESGGDQEKLQSVQLALARAIQ
uniref:Nuclear pore complex protein Nup85 n=1 Tax=Chloropicon laureae TaxID=464258 RepID=A0A7S2Z1I6_9CHLO